MPDVALSKSLLARYKNADPGWGGEGLGYVVMKRTYARPVQGENRLEEWHEIVARCVRGAVEIGAGYTQDEAERLYDHVFHLRGMFGGRFLWVGGTEMVRKHGGGALVNCVATKIEEPDDFVFLFTMLMHGAGVGFSIERTAVHELPKVKDGVEITHAGETTDADFIVPDSREGWSELLRHVLNSFFVTGRSFTYSTILVRPYGAPLQTFGGTASGPQALIDMVTDICTVLCARGGKKIRSVDALDVGNLIGRAVVAGSARRSAELALGDSDDFLFLRAKNWATGKIPPWRDKSNNTLCADAYDYIPDEFWRGYDGSGEPYGLANLRLAQKYGRLKDKPHRDDVVCINPCGEQFLPKMGACNLSELVLPRLRSLEEAQEVARLLYKTQKAITSLSYPFKGMQDAIRKDRRVGLSVMGVAQEMDRAVPWLDDLYEDLRGFDVDWSKKLGVPESVRLTTVQPGGTKPLLPGVTPGASSAKSEHYIRRVRFGENDALLPELRERGYHTCFDVNADGTEERSRVVVEFPCETPKGAIIETYETAVDQLERVKMLQTNWADNAVSITVGYELDELPKIKEWLAQNYDTSVKSLSFLLKEGHGFALAPIEPISQEKFQELSRGIKSGTWKSSVAQADLIEESCESGACPVR